MECTFTDNRKKYPELVNAEPHNGVFDNEGYKIPDVIDIPHKENIPDNEISSTNHQENDTNPAGTLQIPVQKTSEDIEESEESFQMEDLLFGKKNLDDSEDSCELEEEIVVNENDNNFLDMITINPNVIAEFRNKHPNEMSIHLCDGVNSSSNSTNQNDPAVNIAELSHIRNSEMKLPKWAEKYTCYLDKAKFT